MHLKMTSEDDTMSVWEALVAMKQGLKAVTGEADANSEFLTQAWNSLPNLIINLEKLSHHYQETMPKINKVLQNSKTQLSKLKSIPAKTSIEEFGCDIDPAEASYEVHKAWLMSVKTELDQKVSGLRAEISQLGNAVPTPDGRDLGGGVQRDLDVIMGEVTGGLMNLEAQTSGEGFSTGDHMFNSKDSVMEYLVEEKVPNAGIFWDLFSVLATISPKRQKRERKGR
jgi:hypothetical protein